MILSDRDIKSLLKKGEMCIEPLQPGQIQGASIDLTLGKDFWFFKKRLIGKTIDISKTPFTEVLEHRVAKKVTLKPQEMCLGITKEKITLPPYVMGILEGRSRYARLGLSVHITSSLIQPGSSNRQVLEIVNSSPSNLTLSEGLRISQAIFLKLSSPTSLPYAKHGKIAVRQ
ncbi:MAG: dCTP deaminase [Candidatus Anstonellales archaeon]